jgi:hypothetical protein
MNKLNQLFKHCHSGMVLTLPYLAKLGISYKSAWQYAKSGWLEKLGNKAYKKINDQISWTGGISAAQYQLKLPLHVGGKTALQLLGRIHYVPLAGIKEIYLFMPPGFNQPNWLNSKVFSENIFKPCKTSLFNPKDKKISLSIIERKFDNAKIRLSTPERAILEVLYLVPVKQSFEEALFLMEGLANLRPKIVQLLLESCNSIKVKRLFLYMAEKNNLPWVSELNFKKIDLGHGKRKIGVGGVFDSKYLISVPLIREVNDNVSI